MTSKTSDENVANDIEFLKSNEADVFYFRGNPKLKSAIQNILAEREQKDKRIKELEEELGNSIPTQKVIDKIKELKLSGGSDGKDNVENLVRKLTIDILQELLEGDSK